MNNVNPKNGNGTISDIIPWDIFKSNLIDCLIKNIKVLQWFSKSKFICFMIKEKPNKENEVNETFFHGTHSHLTSLFIGRKYFNQKVFFTPEVNTNIKKTK